MNATVEGTVLAKERASATKARKPAVAPDPAAAPLVVVAPTPMTMLDAAARRGATPDELKQWMELHERWEQNEARRAFNVAFANFKAEAVKIIKRTEVKDGPLKGKFHANLRDVVEATTPHLSKHGLAISWKLSKDEPTWMEVSCTLRHVGGHSEFVSMGAAPDAGPGRNAIQARGSAKSYLERYTATAILGLAAQDADDDGAGTTGGATETNGKPDYTNEKINRNLASWKALVAKNGSEDADRIIANLRLRFTVSEEQENRIRTALKEPK